MPIDWDFIAAREGKQISVGYVPVGKGGKRLGKSGMTIGTGFDLGQHTAAEIEQLDISAALKKKLIPFTAGNADDVLKLGTALGKNKHRWPISTLMHRVHSNATTAVGAFGTFAPVPAMTDHLEPVLHLNDTELRELMIASKKKYAQDIIAKYNRAARGKNIKAASFEQLPGKLQTAIASFCFQFGPNIGSLHDHTDRRRKYWETATSQRWAALVLLLQREFPDYRSRRLLEIRLIQLGADLPQ